jgi:hypothetical protein
VVALIPAPDPLNIHCFLEPLLKEIEMYGPLKRRENEQRNEYIQRVQTTKRNHALRVTRVLPLGDNEDEVDVVNGLRHNEWAGPDRPPCLTRFLSLGGHKYLVYEVDVIVFLAAITCDMPQRDKTMNRGGTARVVGCAWCLFEVISHTSSTLWVHHDMYPSWHLTHFFGFSCRPTIFPVHKRKPTKGIWSRKACVGMETIGMSFRRSMLNWLSR